jgi:hypothetical protein
MAAIRSFLIAGALGAGFAMPASAGESRRPPNGLGAAWIPIPAERLAGMRGGFQLASGVHFSFGIERVVFIDGQLVASTRLSIPDVARMTPEEAQALGNMYRTTVIQVGPGNAFRPIGGVHGVVVQNTTDGRSIQVLTTLDLGVGTLGMFQQHNASAAMQAALNRAPGGI